MNQAALGRIIYQQQEQILLNQVQALFLGLVQSILVFSIPQSSIQPQRGGSCNSDAGTTIRKQRHHNFQISLEVIDRFGKHQIGLLS